VAGTINAVLADGLGMPSERRIVAYVLLGSLALVTLLYSLLIARAPLAWVGVMVPLVFLYLVWRFVRAHERIADALEGP